MLPLLAVLVVTPPSTLAGEKAAVANRDVAILTNGDLYWAKGNGRKVQRLAKNVGAFEWSPEGRTIAYQSGEGLYFRELKTGKTTKLPHKADGEVWLTFDPQKPYLVVGGGNEDKLTRVNLGKRYFGASAQFLTQHDSINRAVAWSPDGKTLAFARDGDVWVAKRDPGPQDVAQYYDEANRLAPLAVFNDAEIGASVQTPYWVDGLRWCYGGKRLLFHFQRQGGTGVSQIGWIDLRPTKSQRWSEYSGFQTSVHWLIEGTDPLLFSPDATPDGKAVSATVEEEDARWLELISWDGRHRVKLMKNVSAAQWRPIHGN